MSSFPPPPPLGQTYVRPVAAPLGVPPRPPQLHWGWVLALTIVTVGIFGIVWLLVQANWVKRATGNAGPFWWALAYLLLLPALFLVGIFVGVMAVVGHVPMEPIKSALDGFGRLASLVMYCFAAFKLKGALESEPIGIPLSGVMTFLFAPIYFQYNLRDWDPHLGTTSDVTGLGLSGR